MRHMMITRGAAALAGVLISVSAPAWSHWGRSGPPMTEQEQVAAREHARDRMQARLDRTAQRLAVTPAQQPAWDDYANTVKGLFGVGWNRPAADADAATLARWRAERAAEHAQKLSQLADATARLQQALTPEQRKTLDELARRGVDGGARRGW